MSDWNGNIRSDGLVIRDLSGLHDTWWMILSKTDDPAIDHDPVTKEPITSREMARAVADKEWPIGGRAT